MTQTSVITEYFPTNYARRKTNTNLKYMMLESATQSFRHVTNSQTDHAVHLYYMYTTVVQLSPVESGIP